MTKLNDHPSANINAAPTGIDMLRAHLQHVWYDQVWPKGFKFDREESFDDQADPRAREVAAIIEKALFSAYAVGGVIKRGCKIPEYGRIQVTFKGQATPPAIIAQPTHSHVECDGARIEEFPPTLITLGKVKQMQRLASDPRFWARICPKEPTL